MNFGSAAGLIDPLVHLEDSRYTHIDDVLERATHAGVRHIIWGGTEPQKDIQLFCAAHDNSPNIWRAIGLHHGDDRFNDQR